MLRKATLSIIIILILVTAVNMWALDHSRVIIHDVPDEVIERQFENIPPSRLSRQDSLDIGNYRFDGTTLKVLVILVSWTARPQTYSVETFDSLFFSRGVYPGGSIADYFDEVSYGQVSVEGYVHDWTLGGAYSPSYDFEPLLNSLDSEIDYSQYDGNGDGVVDAVIFIRSGNGKEDSGDSMDIWSYAYSYPMGYGPGPFDGVMVSRWCTSSETFPLRGPVNPQEFSGVDTLNFISTAAHELTHNLGLPDVYDYDDKTVISTFSTPDDNNDHPFVDWCLMGYNGYGLLAIKKSVPPHLCGWAKKEMGWVTPVLLDGEEYVDVVINNVETTNENSLYQIPIGTSDEYFLLEYRNPHSSATFDKIDSDFSVYLYPDLAIGSDSLDRGLMITHVDGSMSVFSRFNNGTPSYPHYAVRVEDASYNPARDATTNPLGHVTDSAQWWYPHETRKAALFSSDVSGQELFAPDTYPSSDGYNEPSGIHVLVDSIVTDKLYVHVWVDPDMDGIIGTADNCPDEHNPLQTDFDLDLIGDPCDNCPYEYNPGQVDSDEDGTGDVCVFICGDANGDEDVNILDIVLLINYKYKNGTEPSILSSADVNKDFNIDILDIVLLINSEYKNGVEPDCW
ncbi:MAG: hypothetical protein GY855_06015, partial [candidate division Zixibacteria bacterium]|nr:hypothetical protein [candidate division Zixibacteria bacterium]